MFQIPIGVIGIPLGVVMLPSMSRDLARGDVASYVSLVGRALRLILWVMLPLPPMTIVLRTEIVRSSSATAIRRARRRADRRRLLFFAIGLAGQPLIAVLARAFYAEGTRGRRSSPRSSPSFST